jgi:putative membrane protein
MSLAAGLDVRSARRDSMIANYTSHAANERTFLAWIRTGLAVAAFGFFIIKLNVFVDAVGRGSILNLRAEDAGAFVAVATRYAGLAMVAIGIAMIARSSFAFERRRRAIDCDEVIQIPQSRAESLLSAALAIAVLIFGINLAWI